MAETRVGGVEATLSRCDDKCGCQIPCPGGQVCRCASSGGEAGMQHSYCSCGKHCSCNPCRCSRTEAATEAATPTGKAFCKCGEGCTCVTCTT